jgi:hypothetical protein
MDVCVYTVHRFGCPSEEYYSLSDGPDSTGQEGEGKAELKTFGAMHQDLLALAG